MAILEQGNATRPRVHDVVGQRVTRVDSFEKITGEAQYVGDVKLPGMLHAKVLRSPYPHARIRSIDTSAAEAMPGVRAVITGKDFPGTLGGGLFIKDMPAMAIDKVRYVGEEVAAVAATSPEIAEAACGAIEVEYEELPAVFDPFEALKPGAPVIHDTKPDNVALALEFQRGDVDTGFEAADVVVEAEFSTHHQYHAYTDPIGCVAVWSQSKLLTIYSNTQSVFMTREKLTDLLGLPTEQIRIIQPYIGGAFGGKESDDNNIPIAAMLAKKAGRPVRYIFTREEEFVASRPRVPAHLRLKMGFAKDGRITAKEVWITNENGAYTLLAAPMLGVTGRRVDHQYRLQNVRIHAKLVYTNRIPSSSMRGFGNPEAHFAQEQVMDMAARELGMDAMDLHLINAVEAGDVTVHGSRLLSCELKQCITTVRRDSDWDRKRRERVPGRGIGMATWVHCSGKRHFENWDGSSAIVKIDPDARITVVTAEGDLGQGSRTILAQICAETLGVPYESVSITMSDTQGAPYADGCHASRMTYIGGNAVRVAAEDARRRLLEAAGEVMGCLPEQLAIERGAVYVIDDPSRSMSVPDVVHRCLFRNGGSTITGVGHWDAPSEMETPDRYGNESGAYGFGAHVAEVEVDPDTGKVTLLNYWTCDDIGTVINPMLAEGQVEGGLVQGLGHALVEWIQNEDGQVINPNFGDYKLPGFTNIPRLHIRFAESSDPTGPFGAKGVGEGSLIPVAPAIANAVFDAVGVRPQHLPISSERVWDLLHPETTTEED